MAEIVSFAHTKPDKNKAFIYQKKYQWEKDLEKKQQEYYEKYYADPIDKWARSHGLDVDKNGVYQKKYQWEKDLEKKQQEYYEKYYADPIDKWARSHGLEQKYNSYRNNNTTNIEGSLYNAQLSELTRVNPDLAGHYQQNLKKARRRNADKKREYESNKNKDRLTKNATNLVKSLTPWGALQLLSRVNPITDWMYGLAFTAAVFKDLFDLVEITGILYIIVVIFTFLASIFIAMMMLLGSFAERHGRREQKIIRSWLTLMSGTTAELLFGVNFLPIETITVAIIYGFVLSDRIYSKREVDIASNSQGSYA